MMHFNSFFLFLVCSIQLDNPGSYSNLSNYFNKFRVCKRKNNWLHSPQHNIHGIEDLPFLKVILSCDIVETTNTNINRGLCMKYFCCR